MKLEGRYYGKSLVQWRLGKGLSGCYDQDTSHICIKFSND